MRERGEAGAPAQQVHFNGTVQDFRSFSVFDRFDNLITDFFYRTGIVRTG